MFCDVYACVSKCDTEVSLCLRMCFITVCASACVVCVELFNLCAYVCVCMCVCVCVCVCVTWIVPDSMQRAGTRPSSPPPTVLSDTVNVSSLYVCIPQ